MLQQQRSSPVIQQQRRPQTPSRPRMGNKGAVTSSSELTAAREQGCKIMSESTSNRRTLLGQSYYQDAKTMVGKALTDDEAGGSMDALELYNNALSSIRSGLAVLQSSVGALPAEGSTLQDLRQKMCNLKEQIKVRMEDLLQQEMESRKVRSAMTKSLQSSATGQRVDATPYAALKSTAVGREEESGGGVREETKADLMFHMDTGIGLFEVDKKDHVMRFDDVDAISIFKYRHPIEGQPPAFLQCGGFIYPLVPGKTPILKSGDKMYMFPDLRSEEGSSVGVCLDSASSADIAHLDQLLTQLADFETSADVTRMSTKIDDRKMGVAEGGMAGPTWGTTMAGGIDKGVNWVSTKIAHGTEMAGNLVIKGASKLRDRIDPNEKPTEISVPVQKGVYYTRRATGCVVTVSDFLMTSLAKLTIRAGKEVKELVQDSELVRGQEVNPHAKEAWKVTKSGVKGAAGVFTDLKTAASAVVRSMGKETACTIGHKYGEDAEKVADDALVAAGHTVNIAATYWSWKTWGITFLGKIGGVITENRESEDKMTQ